MSLTWSRSNRITPPSPASSAEVIGSVGPIVRPRKPTITSRAALRRSVAASLVGLGDGGSVGVGLGDGLGLGLGLRVGAGDGDAGPGDGDGETVGPAQAARPTPTDPATKARSNARLEISVGDSVRRPGAT
jgi:hypothetical protein